jgi:hypothetical protein
MAGLMIVGCLSATPAQARNNNAALNAIAMQTYMQQQAANQVAAQQQNAVYQAYAAQQQALAQQQAALQTAVIQQQLIQQQQAAAQTPYYAPAYPVRYAHYHHHW